MAGISKIRTVFKKGILVLLLLAAPIPVSALHYLPEGCFGQLTDDQVVVYYFTRKFRCQSCETLENTMLKTVRDHYSPSFTSGKLAMCVINVDDPANHHFMDEFEILSTSIYIVEKRSGKIVQSQKLDGVWDVLEDTQAISNLLMKGLAQYLGENDSGIHVDSRENSGSGEKSTDEGNKTDISRKGSKPKHRTSDSESRIATPGD